MGRGHAGRRRDLPAAHGPRARKTKTASEFTLRIDPREPRRNAAAQTGLFVPEPAGGGLHQPMASRESRTGKLAGIWYLAGSNTCVCTRSLRTNLARRNTNVQTSNRRFRDDEIPHPARPDQGRSAIRVRVKFTPVETPLSSLATRSRSWPGAKSVTPHTAS